MRVSYVRSGYDDVTIGGQGSGHDLATIQGVMFLIQGAMFLIQGIMFLIQGDMFLIQCVMFLLHPPLSHPGADRVLHSNFHRNALDGRWTTRSLGPDLNPDARPDPEHTHLVQTLTLTLSRNPSPEPDPEHTYLVQTLTFNL